MYFKSILNNLKSVFFQPDEEALYSQERFLNTEIQVILSELDVAIMKKINFKINYTFFEDIFIVHTGCVCRFCMVMILIKLAFD